MLENYNSQTCGPLPSRYVLRLPGCRMLGSVGAQVIRASVGAALLVLLAAPAAAQSSEVGAGFAILKQSWNECCAYGLGIDFARTIQTSPTRSIAIVGDFSYLKFTRDPFTETDMPIVGGVRFKFFRHKRISVFAQGTAGVLLWKDSDPDDETDFIVGGGGGVQVRLTDLLDVKAQVDIHADKLGDGGGWYNISRFLFGAVIKFGPK